MDIRKLQRAIVDGLEEVKGQNIVVFNTEHLSPLFERVVIASGTSNRQTKALAASVRDAVKARGFGPARTEGEENGEWIIVDCGAAVVHLMQPGIRDYYHLEELWGDKPVRLKLEGVSPRLVKASEPEPAARSAAAKKAPAKMAPAKKAPAKKAPVKKLPAAKGAAKRAAAPAARKPAAAAAPARKPASSKAAVRKAAPAAKGVTRTVGVKRAAAAAPAPTAAKPRRPTAAKSPAPAAKAARRKA